MKVKSDDCWVDGIVNHLKLATYIFRS